MPYLEVHECRCCKLWSHSQTQKVSGVRTSTLWDCTLSIKVPFFPIQKLVLPLLSPEMTSMSLVMARLQTFVSALPVVILAVGFPVSIFQTLMVSVLPVVMCTQSQCQARQGILPCCLSSFLL